MKIAVYVDDRKLYSHDRKVKILEEHEVNLFIVPRPVFSTKEEVDKFVKGLEKSLRQVKLLQE